MVHIIGTMTYREQIESLWNTSSDKDLATIINQLLNLLEQSKAENETIPLDIEMEIFLQANYALGFGGEPAEARELAILYNRSLDVFANAASDESTIRDERFHRLACTLVGGVLSILSSDEYRQDTTAYDIISWEEFTEDSSVLLIIESLLGKLVQGLRYGSLNSWKLELLTFIITLHLITQDLDGDGLTEEHEQIIISFLEKVDLDSEIWNKWNGSWLEYSDYYRFVTLMLTNTSSPEEIWIDEVKYLIEKAKD